MMQGVSGMSGQMESWLNKAGVRGERVIGKPGFAPRRPETIVINATNGNSGTKARSASRADTLAYDIAAIDAVLSGKIADYNERLKRAKDAYDANSLQAAGQRDDALRKAYIAARQAGRVLPQSLAAKGAGGGLALQGTRRIRAAYQNERREAEKSHEAEAKKLQAAYEAEASTVRGLIAKAQAQAQADRLEAMAKAAKR